MFNTNSISQLITLQKDQRGIGMPQLTKIGQISSTLIGTRILPLEGKIPLPIEAGGVEIEHTFRGEGTILKINMSETFTSKSIFYRGACAAPPIVPPALLQISGFYESQSNGIMLRKDDGDRVTWTGHAIGFPSSYMNSNHEGMVFFKTSSDVLASQFNGLAAIVETSIYWDENPKVIKADRIFL